jgi:hypothetical protein
VSRLAQTENEHVSCSEFVGHHLKKARGNGGPVKRHERQQGKRDEPQPAEDSAFGRSHPKDSSERHSHEECGAYHATSICRRRIWIRLSAKLSSGIDAKIFLERI